MNYGGYFCQNLLKIVLVAIKSILTPDTENKLLGIVNEFGLVRVGYKFAALASSSTSYFRC